MKKNIQLLLMSFLFFMTADAQAPEECDEGLCCVKRKDFYAKVLAGANLLQNAIANENRSFYQTGYMIGGSLGYCWRYGLSLEGEYAYRRNGIRKIYFFGQGTSHNGHLQASSAMANLFWNLPLSACGYACWNIKPFIGAGIGYDFQQMHSKNSRINFQQKWNCFSWQMMAGIAYPIVCNTEMTLEYKFHQGGHFYNHTIGIGLVYKFGLCKK